METTEPIELMFGGMEKLGPGSNAHTLRALRLLPKHHFDMIVDAGCGRGRQTLVLAKALSTPVHAVDTYEPFLYDLLSRAQEAGLAHLVRTHCIDMKEIPTLFSQIDLLWSEGAAYNIGFSNALRTWACALVPGALAVVSELSWLSDRIPERASEFFFSGYPDMHSVNQNMTAAEAAGYNVRATFTLPREAWVEGYYDILKPRAQTLIDHPDRHVRAFAMETLEEIEVFECSEDSYGYVFYILQRC